MLKRSPGSQVYWVPSSATELPQGSFQHVILLLSAAASPRMELYGFVAVRVAIPLASLPLIAGYIGYGPTGVQTPHTL